MEIPSTLSHDGVNTTTPFQPRRKTPAGLKVVIGFFYFHLLLVLFPAWSYFQYDLVAGLHLEEPRILADEAVVQTNRAIGLANLLTVIPLNLLAIAGLSMPSTCCSNRFSASSLPPAWGMVSSYMLLGSALYWPTLFLATRLTYASADIGHVKLGASDATTAAVVVAFALWSAWYLSTFMFREAAQVFSSSVDDPGNESGFREVFTKNAAVVGLGKDPRSSYGSIVS